jgi:hypothetical protein
MPRSRRDRDLYRYRPEDPVAQREAAERMKARREQELRGIAEAWEGSIRGRLEKDAAPVRPVTQAVRPRRRRKKSRTRDLIDVISSFVRMKGRRGRGSHRR